MPGEFLHVSFLDSFCKKLLVVVSKLMGPFRQITKAHIITLNGSDSAIVEVHWEVISKNWPPLSQPVWSEGSNTETFSSNWQQYSYTIMALKVYTKWKMSSLCNSNTILSLYCSLRQHSSVQFLLLYVFVFVLFTYFEMLSSLRYRHLFYTFTFPNDTSIYNLLA